MELATDHTIRPVTVRISRWIRTQRLHKVVDTGGLHVVTQTQLLRRPTKGSSSSTLRCRRRGPCVPLYPQPSTIVQSKGWYRRIIIQHGSVIVKLPKGNLRHCSQVLPVGGVGIEDRLGEVGY